jgi:alpha-mannosidase
MRLVHLVDLLLDTFEKDPLFHHFMLDGQTIVLDDYLHIRPEREDAIEEHVRSGRLLIGPWYVLADEFLVSPEALIRNLLQGIADCKRFSKRMDIGYLPDPFGQIGQMPQILQGFGILKAAFRRGLADEPCEIWWEAPDGSRVLTAYLRDGYDNAARAPTTNAEVFADFIHERRDSLLPHCGSENLLLLNGTDHQEPQAEIASLIHDYANQGDTLLLSTLPDYMQALEQEIQTRGLDLPVLRGEMRNPKRHHLLAGVLSSRVWIKQRNHQCEILLERWAEPFSAWAEVICGQHPDTMVWTGHLTAPRVRQPSPLLKNAWRMLMQCHPHDSICGCSIDQVHQEMHPRFDRVEQIAEEITRQSLTALAGVVDTSTQDTVGAGGALVVFNPAQGPRTDVANAELELPAGLDPFEILDDAGKQVPFMILDRRARSLADMQLDADGLMAMLAIVQNGKVLGLSIQTVAVTQHGDHAIVDVVVAEEAPPKEHALRDGLAEIQLLMDSGNVTSFRLQARFATEVTLEMLASDVPAYGYRSYALRSAARSQSEPLIVPGDTIENEFLALSMRKDGTLTLQDKRSDLEFPGLLRFRDQGDCGDSYTYCPVENDDPIEDMREPIQSWRIEDELGQILQAEMVMRLPLELEVDRRSRKEPDCDVPITLQARLLHGVPRVDLQIHFQNTVKDHRLQICFPTSITSDSALYDGHFEIVRRPTGVQSGASNWIEQPAAEQPMRNFVAVNCDANGLMVAARGLREASVSEEGEIAITLLRSFGWLSRDDLATRIGGAGPPIPVPDGQSLGEHTFHLSLIPFSEGMHSARIQAEAFQSPMRAASCQPKAGELPLNASFLNLEPPELCISAVKLAEDGRGLIVRILNLTDAPKQAHLETLLPLATAWQVRMDESILSELQIGDDYQVRVDLRPLEALSLRLQFQHP